VVNLRSILALAMMFALFLGVLGLVQFGFNLWWYFVGTGPERTIDYGGLTVAGFGVVMGVFFLILQFLWKVILHLWKD
jgi:hypothetical protein